MNKATKYSLLAFVILLFALLVLFFLVRFDTREHAFYSSGGIVYFAQVFILSTGVLALFFALAGSWHSWLQHVGRKTWIVTLFVHLPLILLSTLLLYAGLLFLQFI